MGIISCCAKTCGVLVIFLAVLIGWLSTQTHPVAPVLTTIFKLQGLGKPGTEPVPDAMAPLPRPAGEMFLTLPGGDEMPANGLGMCCRPTAYDPVSVRRTVLWFLLQGGRHVDTASFYLNHEAVGLGIKDAVARGVPRKEIFLVTKIWSDHFGFELSIKRCEEMVKELGVDYIDLVLIHAPILFNKEMMGKFLWQKLFGGTIDEKMSNAPEMVQARQDTWKGLSAVRERGLVRNVGISNFAIDHMQQIQELGLAPIAAHQLQFNPWAPDWVKEVVSFCHQHRIAVTGYFSLGGSDKKGKTLNVDAVNEVAKVHGRRPAQILLRWTLQSNVSVIPGTGDHKHMADNLGTYDFSLTDAEMAKLDAMQGTDLAKEFTFFDF